MRLCADKKTYYIGLDNLLLMVLLEIVIPPSQTKHTMIWSIEGCEHALSVYPSLIDVIALFS